VELKQLPANTCPLCRQAALDQSSDQWTCDFCGCRMEFDPGSRRTRITYWPAQYAAYKAQVGSDWMSRRELFERVDAAVAATPEQRPQKLVGPLLIIAAALLLVCVMLGAVASAMIISPSIARTRRVISQAYLPTATTPMTPTATLAESAVITTPAQPILTSPISNELAATPAINPAGMVTTSVPITEVGPATPLPTPALPTPTAPQAVAPQPQRRPR
jgi:hypothetical protein